MRNDLRLLELAKHRLGIESGRTIEAADFAGRAVQLEHVATAGDFVQSVDVLRDQAANATRLFPNGKRSVRDIRFGGRKFRVGFGALLPIFETGLRVAEILVEQDGLAPRPDPSRRAEVGNATFGADSGPGENDRR